ncbi:GNAT family N-acetyltransferase [Streptomyces candidus]|uniref:GNAT superfamily N-acetyltransferase n=1 Tax=Streptomyces candidus TaxID=67283 RepID=A0A7X0LN11_9ACTN|nr:GNAT family N-acetyltransferase [Streptomyces candidus]MBB6433994.1 GNAT superfamily N-acetyltransferase [Streptomyces candidus]
MNDGTIRRATAADAPEVLRLRQVMIDSIERADRSTDWHAASLPVLREQLAHPGPSFAAFVADHPERPGRLRSLACGTLEYRIGSPANPEGCYGYVFSVATDPDQRRRGLARATMEALLHWFREHGATTIDLGASPEAEPLYASLGFRRRDSPVLRLQL